MCASWRVHTDNGQAVLLASHTCHQGCILLRTLGQHTFPRSVHDYSALVSMPVSPRGQAALADPLYPPKPTPVFPLAPTIHFIYPKKTRRSHSKGNFWRDLFGKDVLVWNIEAGPLPGTHSRNRQPVSGASVPPLPPITILLSPSPHYPIITQPTATLRSINSSPGSVQERERSVDNVG